MSIVVLRRPLLAVCCAFFTMLHGLAVAAPEGGNVVVGDGDIEKQGSKTTITQYSPDIVVDWDSFNVAESESVHFEQSTANDSALNRIHDANPSEIWGSISARGNVWLLNPNGVFFSRTAQVSVGSLVAAGLWMDKDDFMRGRYVLGSSRGTGDVSNAGLISATGGGVALLGGQVENSGSIRAHASQVTLASGSKMMVDFDGDGLLRFQVESLPDNAHVSNEGSIEASKILLTANTASGVFAGVVNNGGILLAQTVDDSGGKVRLSAKNVANTGIVDASATGAAPGGFVQLEAESKLRVGGEVSVAAIADFDLSPVVMVGGIIELLGSTVVIEDGAHVDASGQGGGGTILVGGDWQGGNALVRNAEMTTVAGGAKLLANAVAKGDGGKVVVWSDDTTSFAGRIEAKGGANGGDGGSAEVSGKQHLQMMGLADMRAVSGRAGHLLLDPGTVRICQAAAGTCANDPTPDGTGLPPVVPLDTFTDSYIATQLGLADVTITTTTATTGVEDINVESGVSISWAANTLSLSAGNNINLDGTFAGGGNLALSFGDMLSLGASDLSGVGSTSVTGAGSSTLVGPAGDTAWTINGDAVSVGGTGMTLSMVGTLRGGAGADTFTLGGTTGYSIDGGGGTDILASTGDTWMVAGGSITVGGATYTASAIETLRGGGVKDSFTIAANSDSDYSLDGQGGEDVLLYGGTAWDVAGGMVTLDDSSLVLTSVELLRGGAGADTFTLSGATDYSIDGVGGTDVLASTGGTWTVAGGSITVDGATYTVSAIEALRGGAGADSFTIAANSGSDYSLDGQGGDDVLLYGGTAWGVAGGMVTLDDSSLVLTSVELLRGGGGADTFTLGGATGYSIDGGAGTDILASTGDTWTVAGGSITVGGATYTASAIETLRGGGGKDSFTIAANSNSDYSLDGQGGEDVLLYGGTAWGVAGGMVSLDDSSLVLTSVELLRGGAGADIFTLSGATGYSIEGGAGTDTLASAGGTWTVAGGSITVDGATYTASAIEALRGGAGADTFTLSGTTGYSIDGGAGTDTLASAGGTWTVAGGSITVGGATYTASAIEALRGGAGADTFTLGGATGYSIDGGAGTDILASTGDTWTVAGGSIMVGGATYTASAIETLRGGGVKDSFTIAANSNSDYSLDGQGGEDVLLYGGTAWDVAGGMVSLDDSSLVLTSVEILRGGAGADIFTLSGATDYSIDGGAGTDTLASTGGTWTVAGGSITVDGATYTVSAIEALRGGAGADTFTLGGATGYSIEGGAGTDTLASTGGTWTVAGGSITVDGATYTVSAIEALRGGAGADTFTLSGTTGYSIDGGAGTDTLASAGGTWTVAGGSITVGGATYTASAIEALRGGAGKDSFTIAANSNSDYSLDGQGGEDVLLYGGTAWDVAGGMVTLNDSSLVLTSVELLRGGAGADTFTLSGGTGYSIEGGSGTDTLASAGGTWTVAGGSITVDGATYTASAIEALRGGAGADTFTLGGATGYSIDGGAGTDILASTGDTWMVAGGSITVGGATYTTSAIETLRGGAGKDSFTIAANSNSDYSLDGQGGEDVLLYGGTAWDVAGGMVTLNDSSLVLTSVELLRGGAGADTFTLSGATGYSIEGGAGTDTLASAGGTWTVAGGSITVDGATYTASAIEALRGGAGADTFTVSAASAYNIMGRDGTDFFNINAELTGDIDGEGGVDTFTLLAAVVGGLDGGADGDVFNLNAGGSVSGKVDGGMGTDRFVFAGGSVSGTINGGGGADTLDLSTLVGARTVALSGVPNADGFSGSSSGLFAMFSGIDTITGSIAGGDPAYILQGLGTTGTWTLMAGGMHTYSNSGRTLSFSNMDTIAGGAGADTIARGAADTTAATWSITGSGVGMVASVSFTGMENLLGSNGVDNFVYGAGGSVSGNVDGGRGLDTLDLSALAGDRTLTFSGFSTGAGYSGTSAGIFAMFDGINTIIGSTAAGDPTYTLQGYNTEGTWTITEADGGAYSAGGGSLMFANIDKLESIGPATNSFIFDSGGSISGEVDGGGGLDTLDLSAYGVQLMASLSGTPDGNGFGGTVAVAGSANIAFSGINNLIAGSHAGDMVTGLDGVATWTLAATDEYGFGARRMGFSNFENIQGGTGVDTFMVSTAHTGDLSGGAGNDVFMLSGQLNGDIDGEAGTDVLNLDAITGELRIALGNAPDPMVGFAGSVSNAYTVDFTGIFNIVGGRSNSDTLVGFDDAGTWNIGNSDSYVHSGRSLAFSAVENIQGGTAVDTFVLSASHSGNLRGGGGDDVFDINSGSIVGTISGEGGGDMLLMDGISSTLQISLSGVPDSDGYAGAVTGGTGFSFDGIRELVGSSRVDQLTGLDRAASWVLGATDSYTDDTSGEVLSFSSLENMEGGSAIDGFTVAGDHSGNLAGNVGDDTFMVAARLAGSITGNAGEDSVTVTGVGDIRAGIDTGADSDTVTIDGGSVASGVVLGAGDDALTINSGSIAGGIMGQGGGDSFDINGGTIGGQLVAAGGDDVLDFAGIGMALQIALATTPTTDGFSGSVSLGYPLSFSGIDSLIGGSGSDTLVGLNIVGRYDLATTNSYITLGRTLVFSSIELIRGGTSVDTFNVSMDYGGALEGGGSGDMFMLDAMVAGGVSGQGGADSFTLGATGGAGSIDGGDGVDTLIGRNLESTWSVAGGGAGTYGQGGFNQGFAAIENLQGGSAVDSFSIGGNHAGNLLGGGGADEFTIDSVLTGSISGEDGNDLFSMNSGGSVSGDINGGAGQDTFDINGGTVSGSLRGAGNDDILNLQDIAAAVGVTLNGVDAVSGYSGSVGDGISLMFTGINELVGGGGSDRLTGTSSTSSWVIGDSDSYTSSSQQLPFAGFENIQGGSGMDTFTINGAHAGNIMGGDGADLATITATLTGSYDSQGGVDRVDVGDSGVVSGGVALGSGDDTFTISGSGSVSGGVSGGSGADSFDINGGSISGMASGGSGTDIIDLADINAALSFILSGTPGGDGYSGTVSGGYSLDFSAIDNLIGGTATDSLTGLTSGGTFNLGASDSYSAAGRTLAFSSLENIVGGTGVDIFNVNGPHTGDLTGAAGDDTFTISALLTGRVDTGAGSDRVTISAGGVTAGIDMGGDADTLEISGGNVMGGVSLGIGGDTFTISGGMVQGAVSGAEGVDIFNVRGGTISDGLAGDVGDDELDLSGMGTALQIGLTSTAAGSGFAGDVTGGSTFSFSGITEIRSGTGTDELTGLGGAGDSTWRLGTADSYMVSGQTLAFSSLENMQGGNGIDSFIVTAAHTGNLMGGGGDDSFEINLGPVSGVVDGESGSDTLNLSSITGALQITLSGVPDGNGFSGAVSRGVSLNFAGMDILTGGVATTDTLAGADRDSTWQLGAADSYTDDASGQQLMFSGLENMEGGNMADDFTVNGNHGGNLAGNGGDDTFTVSAQLSGSIDGAAGIDRVTVQSTGSVSMGIDTGAGADSVTVEGAVMAGIALGAEADALTIISGTIEGGIMGGGGDDSFDIDGGTISGTLAGGGGTGDQIDLSDIAAAMQLMVTSAPVASANDNGFSGELTGAYTLTRFTGINRVSGGMATDDMTVSGSSGTYNIVAGGGNFDSYDVGGRVLQFDSWENIQAGVGVDTFSIVGDHTGNIMTGGGNDVVTIAAMLTGSLRTEAGGDMVIVSSGGVSGGIDTAGGTDQVMVTGGAIMAGVVLGQGADTFSISSGSVTGGVAAAAGVDSISISGGTVGGGIRSGIDGDTVAITGGSVDGDIDTGAGADQITVSGSAMVNQNVLLGSEDDTLEISGGTIAGNIDAGVGGDEIMVSGTAAVSGGITLGGGDDRYMISGGSVGMGVSGGGDDDTFNINGGTTSGTIAGDGGNDVLSFAATGNALTITLAATPTTDGFSGDTTDGVALMTDFSGIDTITGSTATDLLNGLDPDGTYTLGGRDTYVVSARTLLMNSIENIQGGDGNDIFNINGDHTGNLMGGLGLDSFQIAAVLTGMVVGGAGIDSITVSGGSISAGANLGAGDDVVVVNSGSIAGGIDLGDDGDTITISGGEVSGGIILGAGVDTLVLNGGSINGPVDAGAGQDTFDINGGNVNGVLAGAGEDDVLDLAGISSALSIDLAAADAAVDFSGVVNGFPGVPPSFSFSGINEIVGGGMVDLLSGLDSDSSWMLAATNSYQSNSLTLTFSALENIQGGSEMDSFTVASSHGGNLMGGAGNDVFTVNAMLVGSLSAESGMDQITVGANGSVSVGVDAGVGDDTVIVTGGGSVAQSVVLGDGVDTLSIDDGRITGGVSSGSGDDTITVAATGGIEGGITGGTGSDTFDINGGTVSGTVAGQGDSDTLDMADIASNLEIALTGAGGDGFAGNVRTGYSLDFSGIDSFTSGSGEDQITGLDSAGLWTLAAAGFSYNSNSRSLMFSAVENFFGGSGSDTYNVEVAHSGDIRSGGGDDTININAALNGVVNTGTGGDGVNVNAALTGMVEAENGAIVIVNNSISGAVMLGAADSTVIVRMAGSIGGGLVMAGGANEVFISGGTVTGGIAVSPSAVSAADSLNLDITSGSITGNIIGGGGIDTFRVTGGTISGGSIMARSGLTDFLDLSGNAAAADYRLSDVDGNGFTGSLTAKDNSGNTLFSAPFSGIGGIQAGSGMDTLFGLDRDSSWTVGSTGEYRVMGGTLGLSTPIENIIAGSGIDVFTLTGGYSGNIQGGSGNDMFTITGAHGGNIEGGIGDDGFAINAVVTGIIYGDSSTDASVAGTDSFVLAADSVVTGGIEGGMGTDSFTAPDVSTAASTYMLSAMGVGSYSGGGQTQAFNGMENINAGVGDDIVMVADGAGLTGMFNGGGGGNKLDFSSYSTAVTLTVLDVGGFADGPGFRVSVTPFAGGADNINSFTGGSSSSDALRGIENDANVVSQFGANFVITEGSPTVIDGGVYSARDITNARRFSGRSVEYVAVEVVAGGAAEDTFDITDSGLIQGGGGVDRLDLRESGSTGPSIILSGVSEETGYSGRFVGVDLEFEGIDAVLGSAFSDSITGMGSGGTFEVYRENSGVYIGITDSGALSSKQLEYSFVETIAGQDGNDIFFFEAEGRQSGGIDGGGGRDTLDLSDFTTPVTAILGVNPDTARGRVYTGGVDGAALEVIVGMFETTRDVGGVSVVLPETYWTNIDKIVGASPIGDAEGEARGRSFLVVQPETAATDLIVNREKTEDDDSAAVAITLPDLSEFEGYLFLGGSGTSMVADGDQGARMRIGGVPFPIGGVEAGEEGTVEPLPLSLPVVVAGDMDNMGDMSDSGNEPLINARRLIIGGDVAHRGSVVLLGSTIIMEADLAAGVAVPNTGGDMTDSPPQYNLESAAGSDYSVVAIAAGMAETSDSFAEDENGYIIPVLQDGERERSIYSGEAVIAAAATVQDSFSFKIDLGAGDLQFAQVLSSFVFFNPASNFIGRSLSPDIRTYLTGDLNLNIVEFILSVFNPASSLTQTSAFLIDTGLFEEDLSLFSAIGKGIALYLSMCEELEGCAPPIGLDVLDQLVAAAKDRLATIEVEYSKADARDLPVLIELVRNYRLVVRDMQNVRQEWVAMFAPELLPKDEPTAKDVGDQDLRLDAGRQPQAPTVEKAEIPAATTNSTKLIPEATGSGLNALENKEKTTPPKHRASPGAKPVLVPAPLRGLDGVLPDDIKASKSYQKLFEQGGPEPFKKGVPQIQADISTAPVVSQR